MHAQICDECASKRVDSERASKVTYSNAQINIVQVNKAEDVPVRALFRQIVS